MIRVHSFVYLSRDFDSVYGSCFSRQGNTLRQCMFIEEWHRERTTKTFSSISIDIIAHLLSVHIGRRERERHCRITSWVNNTCRYTTEHFETAAMKHDDKAASQIVCRVVCVTRHQTSIPVHSLPSYNTSSTLSPVSIVLFMFVSRHDRRCLYKCSYGSSAVFWWSNKQNNASRRIQHFLSVYHLYRKEVNLPTMMIEMEKE